MSESSLIEIVASPMRTIANAIGRKMIMGEQIALYMKEISRNLTVLRSNESSLNSRRNQSIGSLLESAKPISINTGNTAAILDTSKKLTAAMYALKSSPVLNELHTEVKLKIPGLDSLVNETNYFLKTGNIDALQVKSAEINSQLKKMNHVLRLKQLTMEKEEIIATSLLIRDSFKEIGFGSIKQIQSKSGGIILRASDRKFFTSIFAEVNASKGIKIDAKGFVGEQCSKTVNALVDKLKEKGIEAKKKERVFHNKIEGGELVKTVEPLFNPLETASVPSRQNEAVRRKKIQYMNKRERA